MTAPEHGTTVSTHVLDAVAGAPAVGLTLTLTGPDNALLADAQTDPDGRHRFEDAVGAGVHTLTFATGPWFAAAGRDTFFPEVSLAFAVDPGERHYHVALLLSPFSYTTYRGS